MNLKKSMSYKISIADSAEDDFSRLDKSVQQHIFKYLKKIEECEDPRTLSEQLQENLSMYWKYRVGDYRLVAEIQDEQFIVLMLVIAHRREVYKMAKNRLNL